jgi:hypothetical protein
MLGPVLANSLSLFMKYSPVPHVHVCGHGFFYMIEYDEC